MNPIPDTYTLKARWLPALISFSPISLAGLTWLGGDQSAWQKLGAALLSTGVGVLATQFARERGKTLEPRLYIEWGGKPTNRKLRHTCEAPEQATRWRELLTEVTKISLPTRQEEANDLATADRKYDVAVGELRSATRDIKKFPLVFKENRNYGFWRNLIGLRIVALPLSLLGIAICIIPLAQQLKHPNDANKLPALSLIGVALLLNVLVCLFWLFMARRSAVRHAAEAYADRLFEALHVLRKTK